MQAKAFPAHPVSGQGVGVSKLLAVPGGRGVDETRPVHSFWPKGSCCRGEPPTLPGFQNLLAFIQSLVSSSEPVLSSESSWSVGSPTQRRP